MCFESKQVYAPIPQTHCAFSRNDLSWRVKKTVFQVDFIGVILIVAQSLQYSGGVLGRRCAITRSISRKSMSGRRGDQLNFCQRGYLTILDLSFGRSILLVSACLQPLCNCLACHVGTERYQLSMQRNWKSSGQVRMYSAKHMCSAERQGALCVVFILHGPWKRNDVHIQKNHRFCHINIPQKCSQIPANARKVRLREPAQSKSTWTNHKSHFLPNLHPAPAFTSTVLILQCGHTAWG